MQIGSQRRKAFSNTLLTLALLTGAATATPNLLAPTRTEAKGRCAGKSGKAYVVCKESQGRYANGQPHPGPSSASGPYGLLNGTRRWAVRTGRCSWNDDDCIANAYVKMRYGSWQNAAAAHRRKNWY